MRHIPLLISLILIFCIQSTCIAGKVYKWTDKNGQVHFGQTPPPDKDTPEYNVRYSASESTKTDSDADASKTNKQKGKTDTKDPGKSKKSDKPLTPQQKVQAMEKNRAAAAKKSAEEKKLAAKNQARCEDANQRLRSIQQGGRLYDINKAGERQYWDDSKRQAELTEAQSQVDSACQ